MSENQKNLAVLIDADNVTYGLIPQILETIGKYGRRIITNAYADWSQENLKAWKTAATKYHIETKQSYHTSSGKNATDIALVIDAMDILHQNRAVEGFCIVSSDSDFTHLARRVRREGHSIIGIGKASTDALLDAYDPFIPLESLISQPLTVVVEPESLPPLPPPVPETLSESELALLADAYKQIAAAGETLEDGWIPLRDLRAKMTAINSAFQLKSRQLADRIKAYILELPGVIEIIEDAESFVTHFVRLSEEYKLVRLRSVYQDEATKLKVKDDGWVLFSSIGSVLKDDPLMYKGIKPLKRVIDRMREDYPSVIDIRPDGLALKVYLA